MLGFNGDKCITQLLQQCYKDEFCAVFGQIVPYNPLLWVNLQVYCAPYKKG